MFFFCMLIVTLCFTCLCAVDRANPCATECSKMQKAIFKFVSVVRYMFVSTNATHVYSMSILFQISIPNSIYFSPK